MTKMKKRRSMKSPTAPYLESAFPIVLQAVVRPELMSSATSKKLRVVVTKAEAQNPNYPLVSPISPAQKIPLSKYNPRGDNLSSYQNLLHGIVSPATSPVASRPTSARPSKHHLPLALPVAQNIPNKHEVEGYRHGSIDRHPIVLPNSNQASKGQRHTSILKMSRDSRGDHIAPHYASPPSHTTAILHAGSHANCDSCGGRKPPSLYNFETNRPESSHDVISPLDPSEQIRVATRRASLTQLRSRAAVQAALSQPAKSKSNEMGERKSVPCVSTLPVHSIHQSVPQARQHSASVSSRRSGIVLPPLQTGAKAAPIIPPRTTSAKSPRVEHLPQVTCNKCGKKIRTKSDPDLGAASQASLPPVPPMPHPSRLAELKSRSSEHINRMQLTERDEDWPLLRSKEQIHFNASSNIPSKSGSPPDPYADPLDIPEISHLSGGTASLVNMIGCAIQDTGDGSPEINDLDTPTASLMNMITSAIQETSLRRHATDFDRDYPNISNFFTADTHLQPLAAQKDSSRPQSPSQSLELGVVPDGCYSPSVYSMNDSIISDDEDGFIALPGPDFGEYFSADITALRQFVEPALPRFQSLRGRVPSVDAFSLEGGGIKLSTPVGWYDSDSGYETQDGHLEIGSTAVQVY